MANTVFMQYGSGDFTTSPKLPGYDMVVLNIDENNYISSPFAKISEISDASAMTDTSKSYPYIGSDRGYTKNKWYSHDGSAWVAGSNYSPWSGRSNGRYRFTWNSTQSAWRYNSYTYYTTEQLYSTYAIEVHYANTGTFTDTPKDGDVIEVVLIKNTDASTNDTQPNSISCNMIRSGSVLEATCPLVKGNDRQAVADNVLESLYGYEYQPYTATNSSADPAAELGDAVLAYGVYSGIYSQELTFDSLMASDIGAPHEEELESEMAYESSSDRNYKRKFAEISAEFIIQSDEISARVEKTGTGDGFSWSLVYDAFKISSGNREVFKVDKTGAHVMGEITAETGYIGTKNSGFKINSKSIYNGIVAADSESEISMSNINDSRSTSGIYVGTDGIYLGGGKFTVTRAGAVTASSGTVGGFTLSASAIYSNGQSTFGGSGEGIYLGSSGLRLGSSFKVTSSGAVTASDLSITGGSIKIGGTSSSPVFQVTNTGAVTASNLTINGGSISIGGNFSVDSNGNLRANSGTFNGTVHAGNIISTSASDTMSGSYLTSGSIGYNSSGALGSSWFNGASGGNFFNSSTTQNTYTYPGYFRAGQITCSGMGCSGSTTTNTLTISGYPVSRSWNGVVTGVSAWLTYESPYSYINISTDVGVLSVARITGVQLDVSKNNSGYFYPAASN